MTGVKTYLLDTNIILRFLIQDDPGKALAVKRLVEQARHGKVVLMVPFMAVTETIFTLRSVYRVGLVEAAKEVSNFLNGNGVELTSPGWVLDALEECQRRKVSFGDACIAAEARANKMLIASFDTDFDRYEGVTRVEPK